jgi:geranylgeranyl diphosphate synthase type II
MHFDAYKSRFEVELGRLIEELGDKGVLRDACEYVLQGGKRLRPLIVLMTADALGKGLDAMPAAFSAECFHSASLIADDLPCMDNDALRRGRPSLHKAFGESAALLASYTLIAAGYGGISKNGAQMKLHAEFQDEADLRSVVCLEVATRCAGLNGATQGQYLDLYPPDSSLETIREIIYKKTVTLFEISFIFGWIFGGGSLSAMPLLKECASHLGLAFQIADDLEDAVQDAFHESPINIAAAIGKEKAISLFGQEITSLKQNLIALNLWTPPFQELIKRLKSRPL